MNTAQFHKSKISFHKQLSNFTVLLFPDTPDGNHLYHKLMRDAHAHTAQQTAETFPVAEQTLRVSARDLLQDASVEILEQRVSEIQMGAGSSLTVLPLSAELVAVPAAAFTILRLLWAAEKTTSHAVLLGRPDDPALARKDEESRRFAFSFANPQDVPPATPADHDAMDRPTDLQTFLEQIGHLHQGFSLPPLGELARETARLTRVIGELREPTRGCPWDRKQTFASLQRYLIEEAYEATEAAQMHIQGHDKQAFGFLDELGDVLLQVVLNSQLAAEAHLFNFHDIVVNLTEKMIRRHPHVFAPEHAQVIKDSAEVVMQWEKIKETEREQNAKPSLLQKAQKKKQLPTLEYACYVSERAAKLGFAWAKIEDIWGDVLSEVRELEREITKAESINWDAFADELGDVMYALANLCTHVKLHHDAPEDLSFDAAARAAVRKFCSRFAEMELIHREDSGQQLTEEEARRLDIDTWNELWKRAKQRRYR